MTRLEEKTAQLQKQGTMTETTKTHLDVDLAIIGAGSAGLSAASGAAQLGRSVVLFEAEEMGGDCLNTGCVPSKAIIAAGRAAQAFREAEQYGIENEVPDVNFNNVKAHIQSVIATIAPHDSQERFEDLGVNVIRERAKFSGRDTLESATHTVKAKRIIVATGSRAAVPPIPGLKDTPHLTNETIWSVDEQPSHLIIIGAGPIGIELGQAFRRLGSDVTIIDIAAPLGRNEPEHASALVAALLEEGVTFHAPAKTKEIRKSKGGVEVELEDGTVIKGSHILVGAGRAPNVEGLDLEAAGITYDKRGIETDANLRTSNPTVFAAGDVAKGKGGLTHAAGYHAGVLIMGFYFLPPLINRLVAKASTEIPAAIYSEPGLASIGMTEAEAKEKGIAYKIATSEFHGNDRAIAERRTKGSVKIVATKRGKILGASVLGEEAGNLIQIIQVAMANGIKLSKLARHVAPYPTRGDAVRAAASGFYSEAFNSPKTKKVAAFMSKFH